MQGAGKMTFSVEGGQYTGTFVDNKQHGQGKRTWKNGDVYEGTFKHGLREGKGKYLHNDGDKYEGLWVNNERVNY